MTGEKAPIVWITYPWIDFPETEFGGQVRQFTGGEVEAVYDSVRMMAEISLWDQLSAKILEKDIRGWGFIVTPRSLMRKRWVEELRATVAKVLKERGMEFPVLALLHGVKEEDLPEPLRVRFCIPLSDPSWRQMVSSALLIRSNIAPTKLELRYVWAVHPEFGGNPAHTAIEVHPAEGGIDYWRFALPEGVEPVQWGQGPAGGKRILPIRLNEIWGSGKHEGCEISWFGAGNFLSPTESAYVVLRSPLPEFIGFGEVFEPHAPPDKLEIFETE